MATDNASLIPEGMPYGGWIPSVGDAFVWRNHKGDIPLISEGKYPYLCCELDEHTLKSVRAYDGNIGFFTKFGGGFGVQFFQVSIEDFHQASKECEIAHKGLHLSTYSGASPEAAKVEKPKMQYIISYSIKGGVPESPNWGANPPYNKVRSFNLSNRVSNPWRIKALRKLDGRHPDVKAFLMRCKQTQRWVDGIYYFLKCGQDVFVGCTSGRHRSVAIAEMIAERAKADGKAVTVIHRDLPGAEPYVITKAD